MLSATGRQFVGMVIWRGNRPSPEAHLHCSRTRSGRCGAWGRGSGLAPCSTSIAANSGHPLSVAASSAVVLNPQLSVTSIDAPASSSSEAIRIDPPASLLRPGGDCQEQRTPRPPRVAWRGTGFEQHLHPVGPSRGHARVQGRRGTRGSQRHQPMRLQPRDPKAAHHDARLRCSTPPSGLARP